MKETVPPEGKLDDIGSYIRGKSVLGLIVQDVLDTKGSDVLTITPESPLQEALEILSRNDVGALVVVEGKKVAGMISERDFAREETHGRRDPKTNSVLRIMSSPVQTVAPEDSVSECMSLMTVGHVRHLPVCKDEHLVGLVSIGDLVNSCLHHRQSILQQYDKYIRRSR